MSLPRIVAFSSFTLLAAACGGSQTASSPPQAPPLAHPGESGGSPSTTSAAAPGASASGGAHALLVATAACWFGGVWGDALGEPADQRKAGTEARCNDVVRQVYGAEDKTHFEKLRAIDVTVVDDVAAKLGSSDANVKTLRALADAEREALEARRSADKVKKDLSGQREPEKLTSDEVTAVPSLKSTKALEALLKLDAGDLTHDAHALGLLTAMDRIETSRGLPKHLKVYALEGSFSLLFGSPQPNVPEDATKRLDRGAYLAYLTEVAKAAGHPVPDTAKTPKEREPFAWAGALEGLADKLKGDVDQVKSTTLNDVLTRVAGRLQAEYTAEKNAHAVTSPNAPAPAAAGTAASAGPKVPPKPPAPPPAPKK